MTGRATRKRPTIIAHSAGGVVVGFVDGFAKLLLIKNSFDGHWTIAKGHLEPGEASETAAVREVAEETGIESEIIELLGSNTYHFRRGEQLHRKTVDVYLMLATGTTDLDAAKFDPEEQLVADVRWFDPEEAVKAIGYKNLQPLVRLAADRAELLARRARD